MSDRRDRTEGNGLALDAGLGGGGRARLRAAAPPRAGRDVPRLCFLTASLGLREERSPGGLDVSQSDPQSVSVCSCGSDCDGVATVTPLPLLLHQLPTLVSRSQAVVLPAGLAAPSGPRSDCELVHRAAWGNV